MSAFNELVRSESFLKMCITVGFWLILYVIVRFITIGTGPNGLLKVGVRGIVRLRKQTRKFRILCTSAGSAGNVSRAVRQLKKVIKAEKTAARFLTIYLYDDHSDLNVSGAKDIIARIPDVCRKALVSIAEKEGEGLVPIFDQADTELKEAIALLKKASAMNKKKELLQLYE